MNETLVGIVIPTHNRRERLLECLASLTALEERRWLAVVVLDGCVDGSAESVASVFPQAIQLRGDGSLWWSGSVNAGCRTALERGATHVLLLNDDVRIAPNSLSALLALAQQRPDAIVGSRVFDESGRIWCAGGATEWFGRGTRMLGNGQLDGEKWHSVREVDWLPGMGSLIPAEVLRRTGGMDAAAFPQYFGDTDFCLRARKLGVPILVCPDSQLVNRTELTGVLLRPGKATPADARLLLWSIRSHANIPTRVRFWMRHCPPVLVPYQFVRFYAPIFASLSLKLLR